MDSLQWYPGHMTKARRQMQEDIKLVDLVIELCDARIPVSSRNPDIDELARGKSRILIMNKCDLADPSVTARCMAAETDRGIRVISMDARTRRDMQPLQKAAQEACSAKRERDRARGILNRPVRAMIAGIPNVGKSTLINSLAGRASAKTGNKPGVTKGRQWIALPGNMQLLDTPGILWPKFDDPEVGMRLAVTGAIADTVTDPGELALWLIRFLTKQYDGMLEKRYLEEGQHFTAGSGNAAADILRQLCDARNLYRKGQEPDYERMAALLIDDFRNGRIGRISLERN